METVVDNQARIVPDEEQTALVNSGLRIEVLNRTRYVLIKIDLDIPLHYLRWEGRGDRLLIFWKDQWLYDSKTAGQSITGGFVTYYARAISLPYDVDFQSAIFTLTQRRILMRLPKLPNIAQKLIRFPFESRKLDICLSS